VRLKESSVLVMLSASVLGAGCSDSTSPPERHQATIYAIQTSPHAAVTDTIHISFQYNTSPCDTDVVLESQLESDGIRLGVSSMGSNEPCPIAVTSVYRFRFSMSLDRCIKPLSRCALRNQAKRIACV
jgi:hypothetical protein